MTDDLRERVESDIDRRLDRLRERFGAFPIEEETVENAPGYFEQGRELAAAGWRGDAGAWIADPDDRILLIRHEEAGGAWGIPGGGHEPGERFEETARREAREETGIHPTVTGVWMARRKTFVHAENGESLEMLTVWFEGETDEREPETAIRDGEIEAARWFAEPPERVVDRFEARVRELLG